MFYRWSSCGEMLKAERRHEYRQEHSYTIYSKPFTGPWNAAKNHFGKVAAYESRRAFRCVRCIGGR